MRDLDQRAQDLMKEIDRMAEEYLENVRQMSPEKRSQHLAEIQKRFGKSREFGDDKVQLAMQTYEMVKNVMLIFKNKIFHFLMFGLAVVAIYVTHLLC